MKRILKMQERDFIDKIMFEGMDELTAYKNCFVNERDLEEDVLIKKAKSLRNSERCQEYEAEIAESLRDDKTDRAKWNLEMATDVLLELKDTAMREISEKGLKKTSSDTAMGAIKELNNMYGINEKNINLNTSGQVIIYGEDEILP